MWFKSSSACILTRNGHYGIKQPTRKLNCNHVLSNKVCNECANMLLPGLCPLSRVPRMTTEVLQKLDMFVSFIEKVGRHSLGWAHKRELFCLQIRQVCLNALP
jgi:hypothetical protein